MPYTFNPFTNELDYYIGVSTGTEIVALLEALVSGSRLSHDDGLSDVSANDHHNQAHVLNASDHTVSGLTTGHFLKAAGATSFAFAAHGLTYSDVGAEVSGAVASHESTYNHASYDSHVAAANPHSGHALESVVGTSIGAGLLLTTTVLSVSAILQKYHAIDPAANVRSLLGAANYAAMLALLSGEAGATFSWNDRIISDIAQISVRKAEADGKIYIDTNSDDVEYSRLYLRKSHTDTLATQVATVDTEILGQVVFVGVDTAPGFYNAAYILATQDGNATATKVPAKLEFWTSSATVRAARMSISPVGNVDIIAHDAATVGLKLGGTLVTASAAELNILDGVTATAAELNYLDGETAQLILMNEVFS